MTIPASGALTVGNIRTELGASGQINLGGASSRGLSGVASGVIKMSDFYGKSASIAGKLWLCGYNNLGQIGDNTVTSKSSPVQTIAGGTNWSQVALGASIAGGIKSDGTLWVWGDATNRLLGDGSAVHKSSPVQTVAGGTNWKSLSLGAGNVSKTFYAIKTDGTLWSWGLNTQGQLGDNTAISKSSPVQTVAGGTNWSQVAAGKQHVSAIKTDGTLWSWGSGNNGALGNNAVLWTSSPVQTVAGGTNWKQVSCGYQATAAIKTDGTLWTWGQDWYGQLGIGSTTHKSSPVQTICGGTNWKQVSMGSEHMAAIKTDGTLWTCGYNLYGQLGDNTTTHRSSPVQTVAGGTNWSQVAVGVYCTAAIKTDGTLWTCGYNAYGQLGIGNTVNKSSPVQTIMGGTNWKQVTFGSGSMAAIQ